jgi:hypothetical protein
MSGYFARLASQVNGAAVPGKRRSAQEPAPLEQHVEVEAPPGQPLEEPMEGAAAAPRQQRKPAVANGAPLQREPRQAEPPAAAAADAARAVTAPGKDMPAHETPSIPPGPADAVESTGTAFTAADGEATPPGPPAHRMAPSAMAAMAADAAEAGEAAAPGARTAAASRLAAGLAGKLPGHAAGDAAERTRPARPYAGFSASTARPGTPAEAPAASRNDIRIGTITLEVRPPAVPVPAAPAPVAPQARPAPTAAPQQVALRRYYLRWS